MKKEYRKEHKLTLTLEEVKSKFKKEIKGTKIVPSNKALREICYYWKNIDLTKLNTKKITRMDSLFENQEGFKQNISNWNLSNLMEYIGHRNMFKNCNTFFHNVSSWGFDYNELGLIHLNMNDLKLTHEVIDKNILELNIKDSVFLPVEVSDIQGLTMCYFEAYDHRENIFSRYRIFDSLDINDSFSFFIVANNSLHNIDIDTFQFFMDIECFRPTLNLNSFWEHIDNLRKLEKEINKTTEKLKKQFSN